MLYPSKNLTGLLLFCIGTIALQACHDETVSSGNYFPLSTRTLQYQDYFNQSDDDPYFQVPTLRPVEIAQEMNFDKREYRLISNLLTGQRIVRKQGNRYFARNQKYDGTFDNEYLFLDSSLPEGSTWTEDMEGGAYYKIQFTIREKDASPEVFGKVFNNVIIVEETILRKGEISALTGYRYYQRDVGEVFSYTHYPYSGVYANVTSVLIK